uniref:Gamma-glutamyltranspeptidase 1 n=1 Tax=Panagrellus redivivus TaxID=6233 RepID=A0A7E4VNC5_PANRE
MMTAISRIEEDAPLLPPEDAEDAERVIPVKKYAKARRFAVAMVGFVCLLFFIIATVLFLVLWLKLSSNDHNKMPEWPKPTPSHLGEYSKAAVAADNEFCSDIGRDILLRGGNAVDAAIAALFCIGVMDTHSAGLGGGHFMTIYNATTKKCHVVDARETAPASAFTEMYKDKWNNSKYGWEAIAVPGELHGMWTEYSNFGGGVNWSSLITPTLEILNEGYPTSHALAHALHSKESQIYAEPTMKEFINPDTGKVYKVGEQIKTRSQLAKTLEKLANAPDPVELFYRGELADQFVAEFKQHKGLITKEDLANYASIIRPDKDVMYTTLKGGRFVCGPPPPSGAAVTQALINVMDGYDLSNVKSFNDFDLFFHRFIESSKFAYGGRSELGDMAFVKNATDIARNITSAKWANLVRSRITDKSHPDAYYGGDFAVAPDHGTSSISVIDKYGNAVAVTSTINLLLGAIVASESTGVLWNDEMDDFSSPGHPNYFDLPPSPANFIKPGKRPMSSMSPIIIFSNNSQELLAVGAAGGSTIISGVAGVSLHTLWLGEDIKTAIDFPRFHNQQRPNITYYESRMPQKYVDVLESKHGQTFTVSDNDTVVTAVHRASDGAIYANSDFRKGSESEPAGY